MDEAVVVAAHEEEVVEVGGAACGPGLDVVGVAPVRGPVAAAVAAVAVLRVRARRCAGLGVLVALPMSRISDWPLVMIRVTSQSQRILSAVAESMGPVWASSRTLP